MLPGARLVQGEGLGNSPARYKILLIGTAAKTGMVGVTVIQGPARSEGTRQNELPIAPLRLVHGRGRGNTPIVRLPSGT